MLPVHKNAAESLSSEVVTFAVYDTLQLHTSHTDKTLVYVSDEVKKLELEENKVAQGMCIPIELFGIPFGHALVDQGATRSVIRQTAIEKLGSKIKIRKVKNMSVLCSSGHTVPIIGSFLTPIYSGGTYISTTLLYIVGNTKKNDIVCDIVLGITYLYFAYLCTGNPR